MSRIELILAPIVLVLPGEQSRPSHQNAGNDRQPLGSLVAGVRAGGRLGDGEGRLRMGLESISALILDDNAHMRGLLRVILAGFGVRNIEEAGDCARPWPLWRGAISTSRLSTSSLAGSDGLDFCRRIRLAPDSPNRYLPIVVITAYSERSRVIDAINAGVDEFLVKPIRAVDVANRVNAVIERRRPFVESRTISGRTAAAATIPVTTARGGASATPERSISEQFIPGARLAGRKPLPAAWATQRTVAAASRAG